MNRLIIFIAILAAAIAGFVASLVWVSSVMNSNAPFYMGGSMREIMNQMMSARPQTATTITVPFYMMTLPFVFIAVLVLGIVGVVYYAAVPHIPTQPTGNVEPKPLTRTSHTTSDVVMRALKPDERRVLEILLTHGGKCLQKDITREAGLSRLKIHRIIARLVERNVVHAREYGNTREIFLADWIESMSAPNTGVKKG